MTGKPMICRTDEELLSKVLKIPCIAFNVSTGCVRWRLLIEQYKPSYPMGNDQEFFE
jgi:hypothetical protein